MFLLNISSLFYIPGLDGVNDSSVSEVQFVWRIDGHEVVKNSTSIAGVARSLVYYTFPQQALVNIGNYTTY